MSVIHNPFVDRLIEIALLEDLCLSDVTTELCIDPNLQGTAKLIAKETMIVCGLPIIESVLRKHGTSFQINDQIPEGTKVNSGSILAIVSASISTLLATERTILNFVQRLSGVATRARQVCKNAAGIVVLDTRKTLPGWRILDKYATTVGGACNHRMTLGDMIMVKNNHIDCAVGTRYKSLVEMLLDMKQKKSWYIPIEVEVRDLAELAAALEAKVEFVMLDNMDNDQILKALKLIGQQSNPPQVEISGSITSERLGELAKVVAKAGGKPISVAASMGSLTHSVRSVDISMGILPNRS